MRLHRHQNAPGKARTSQHPLPFEILSPKAEAAQPVQPAPVHVSASSTAALLSQRGGCMLPLVDGCTFHESGCRSRHHASASTGQRGPLLVLRGSLRGLLSKGTLYRVCSQATRSLAARSLKALGESSNAESSLRQVSAALIAWGAASTESSSPFLRARVSKDWPPAGPRRSRPRLLQSVLYQHRRASDRMLRRAPVPVCLVSSLVRPARLCSGTCSGDAYVQAWD